MTDIQTLDTDILIIGSGGAGSAICGSVAAGAGTASSGAGSTTGCGNGVGTCRAGCGAGAGSGGGCVSRRASKARYAAPVTITSATTRYSERWGMGGVELGVTAFYATRPLTYAAQRGKAREAKLSTGLML